MIAKLERTQNTAQQKHRLNTEPHNGSNTKEHTQQQNHHLRMDSSLNNWGLNAFYLHQIFALDSVVVNSKCLARMETF